MTSLKFLYNIIIQPKNEGVCFLSENHDKLLIGTCTKPQLQVFDNEGHYMSTVKVNGPHLAGALWSLNGNIVYAIKNRFNQVSAETESGDVVTRTIAGLPSGLSISNDGVILLSTDTDGIYQSDDNGLTWHFLFILDSKARSVKVFKLPNVSEYNYWVLEDLSLFANRLRVCKIVGIYSTGCVQCIKKSLPSICADKSNCPMKSSVLYLGNESLIFSQPQKNAVYLLSESGQYLSQLLSSKEIESPYSMAMNNKHHHLYLGQKHGIVGVFEIEYV